VSPEPAVRLEHVSKSYRTPGGVVEALREVDGELAAAAVTAVVGVSGSGKSTLLRLIAGHDAPTSGRIAVAGDVAFVSQRAADNLFPQLTLAEHAADEPTLELLEIAHLAGRRASELSGGELARASITVALGRGAGVVVIDEPTAELDRESAAGVLAAIRAASERGVTFVVATHDPDVLAIADSTLDLTRRRPAPPRASASGRERGEVVLRADGLAKAYDGAVALHDATLEVRAGQLGVLVGRSGSGKSTLLMLLGGWLEPDRGTSEPRGRAWRELAYVPQRFGLVPELTVEQNVELPARLAGDESQSALLEALDLAELRDRLPGEISIGQQQRVAIARALRLSPRVLLVDEPTSHQDADHAEIVWAVLRDAASGGTACLVATHELDAQRRADVSWRIESGALAQPLLE
jgi:putative ABC transport system ATP-binding protein